MDVFRRLDRNNTGRIDAYKLHVFLKEAQDHISTNEELVAIIRRIDLDGDDQISFAELRDFLP